MFTKRSLLSVGTGTRQAIDPGTFTRALQAAQGRGLVSSFEYTRNHGWLVTYATGDQAWVKTAREAWFTMATLASAACAMDRAVAAPAKGAKAGKTGSS